jgi:hypothetical protein
VAHATDRTSVLPVPKPKKATPERRALMLAIVDGGQVLFSSGRIPASGAACCRCRNTTVTWR